MDFIKYVKNMASKPANTDPFVSAVVVAAGRSERMGTGKSKQFINLGGVAAIARTLSAFESSRLVREVIVVTNRFDMGRVMGVVKEFGFGKVVHIVVGGETRQQSAARGFGVVSDAAEFVAVHDGARPLVTAGCIDRVIAEAYKCGAASAAVRVKDTVKVADESGAVLSTPDRQHLWAVQTPQVFGAGLYRSALAAAENSGEDYTDDCQLIEASGGRVQLVEGEYTNIKITTAEDISHAEAIIRARGDVF